MISYKEALSIIKKTKFNISNEKIIVNKSLNRVCAENIFSPCNYPAANNAAFDGFGLVKAETDGINKNNLKKFKIIKTIAAGDNPKIRKYKKGCTVEIMTGSIIPKPFNTIIPIEMVKILPSKQNATHIVVKQSLKKFLHIRFKGSDYKFKDLIIEKGQIIEPKHLMALITLGIKKLLVKKKPKVIFVSTGSELVSNSKKNIFPWQIRNSNNYYLSSLNQYVQSQIIDGGIIRDNQENKLKKILKRILKSDVDIVLTSGAVSAGKFDFVPKTIKKFGIKKIFKNVAIRPGKPILFAKFKKKKKFFFGLPGNPISSAACFRFFVYPFLRKGLGMKEEKKFKSKLSNKFYKKKNFTRFLKGITYINKKGFSELKVLEGQQSYKIKSFVKANSWGIFNAGKDKFKKGELIDCLPLNPDV